MLISLLLKERWNNGSTWPQYQSCSGCPSSGWLRTGVGPPGSCFWRGLPLGVDLELMVLLGELEGWLVLMRVVVWLCVCLVSNVAVVVLRCFVCSCVDQYIFIKLLKVECIFVGSDLLAYYVRDWLWLWTFDMLRWRAEVLEGESGCYYRRSWSSWVEWFMLTSSFLCEWTRIWHE